jgi:hypothetical protein
MKRLRVVFWGVLTAIFVLVMIGYAALMFALVVWG